MVREGGGVEKKIQKQHLTMSILEAYRYCKNEHPESIIGKSKFAELRPSHVLRSSLQEMCVFADITEILSYPWTVCHLKAGIPEHTGFC